MSTVTVTPTVEPSTGPDDPPRIRLDVVDTGDPAVTQVTVTRTGPDGVVVPVRTGDGAPLPLATSGTTRIGTLYDYEAPLGAPVAYSSIESPGVASAQVVVDADDVWLIHPGVPALSRPVLAAGISERTRRVTRGVHQPSGRKHTVTQSDGQRKAPEWTLTVRTTTDADRTAVDALLEDAGVLLLNVPASWGWGINAEYVSVGDSVEQRLMPYAPEPRRHWQLPLLVTDRPEGGSQAERDYADILADYEDYAALLAAYPTYYDLLSGP
ncbi:hypothetical protein [Geodermatophilus chilensis]|uniref:hypothetical protein n=1 Tax=Geodermatophilus chilensis TaxID=2035835 RepID=UPI000C25A57D|nr:hypothetical protein [Geodermatophilus chilensis]